MNSHTPHPSVFSLLLKTLKHYQFFFLIQLTLAALEGIYSPIRYFLFKKILDSATLATTTNVYDELQYFIMLFCAFQIMVIASYRIYDRVVPFLMIYIRKHVGEILIDRIMMHSHGFYQRYFSGAIANKVNDLLKTLPSIEQRLIESLFTYIIQILLSLYAAAQVDTSFSILLIGWIISSFVLSSIVYKKSKEYSQRVAKSRSKVMGRVVDTLTNIMSVRLFNGFAIERHYFDKSMQKAVNAECQREWFLFKTNTLQGFSFIAVQLISLYWLVQGLKNNTCTVGDFALIMSLNSSIIDVLWHFANEMRKVSEEIGVATQAYEVIMLPFDMHDLPNAGSLNVTDGSIRFEHVQFGYNNQAPIFSDLSLTIKPGQKVGLVGYSGSGKSTFVNLVLRLFDIQKGAIYLDGQNIAHVSRTSLRNAVAMVGQEPLLFHRTIMENIRYGNPDATEAQVIEAAKKADAHDFIMGLPKGYETKAGERGGSLSGGQRQRISIARALLKQNETKILILDEATSQLDSITESHIQQSLALLMADKTTLIIAHRLSTLLDTDRILVFDKGVIVQDGSHHDLIKEDGLYKTLWQTQTGGFLAEGTSEDKEPEYSTLEAEEEDIN